MNDGRTLVWVSVALGLVACGAKDPLPASDVDAATSPPPPDARVFPPELAWGPPGTPLPIGAEIVSVGELAALGEDLQPVTRAQLDEAAARERERLVAAKQLVDGLAASAPELAHLRPVAPVESPTLRRAADGNYRVDLGDETVITHGTSWLYGETAASLTRTPSRANREAEFRSLIDRLPGDRLGGLPGPGELSGLDDAALAAANRELVRRVELYVPNLSPEGAEAASKPELVSSRYSGCTTHQPDGIYARVDWPLKPYTTRVRQQGGRRATCVAHSILAGVEVRILRTLGLKFDLSEQELYAVAKGIWSPTGNDFGDGLDTDDVLDELRTRGSRIDAEVGWVYNISGQRVEDDDDETYTHSCDGYTGFCSDTNHQMKYLCAGSGSEIICGYRRPPAVGSEGHDPAQLTGYVSLWNPLEPENSLASIRAHLNAGHPVVFSFAADDRFMDAAHRQPEPDGGGIGPGVVNFDGGGDTKGGHAVLVVGYVENGQLPPGVAAGAAFGGGYLITKNSWGCLRGDGGFMHLAYDWVIDQAVSAFAVTGVATTAIAPSGTLTADRSVIDEAPGYVNFTVHVNRATTRVEIFRGQGTGHKILTKDIPGGQNDTVTGFDGFVDSGQNGIYMYWARLTDQHGNVAASPTVGVQVNIDDEDPEIQLSAEATAVPAPGTVRLSATATDDVGVTVVRFYRGFQLIGEDTTKPYTMSKVVGLADIGTSNYVAIAFDAAGNQKMSNVIPITVASQLTPFVFAFSATPTSLPAGGGTTTLSWTVAGANSVSIAPGIGAVANQGTTTVALAQSTTYVLTAKNGAGTTTAMVYVQVSVVVPPIIQSFTATPAAVPAGGGTVTLAWSVLGSGVTLAVDNGVGDVTGLAAKTVAVNATTTFRLTATNAGGTSTRDVTVTALADTSPPAVSLAASPTALVAPGSTLLTATATDASGVTEVTFLRGGTVVATDDTPGDGFTAQIALGAADAGQVSFTARARDASGNVGESAPAVVTVTVPGVPPIIAGFTATPSALPAGGGQATLAWSVAGATRVTIEPGVGVVDAQGSTPVLVTATTTYVLTAMGSGGTTTASATVTVAAPTVPVIDAFTATPPSLPAGGGTSTLSWSVTGATALAIDHGVGDVTGLGATTVTVGATTTYRLTATSPAGSATRDVTVTVAAGGPTAVFVSPVGSDAGNDCATEAAPCKTIARAVTQASAGAVVWLLDGEYTTASQGPTEVVVTAGLTVRSKSPGGARLGISLKMTGGALEEIVIDRTIGLGRVRLMGGITTLAGLRWKGAFAGAFPTGVGLDISGGTIAELTPGQATNYAAETTSENLAYSALIEIRDTASLAIHGGTFDGPGVGYGSNTGAASGPCTFIVTDSGSLVLEDVLVRAVNRGVTLLGGSLTLSGTTLEARAITAQAWGIRVNNSASPVTIVLEDAAIRGFGGAATSAGIIVASGGGNHPSATISVDNVTLSGNGLGLLADGLSTVAVSGSGLRVDDNQFGGVRSAGALDLELTGGSFSRNGFTDVTGGTRYGGLSLGAGESHVKLRGFAVRDNGHPLSGALTAGNSGLTLAGNAASTFDLGTAADPGGNTITGNDSSSATTGIDVKVNAAVTVTAVGNVFQPGVQGAGAAGEYTLGVAPCGAEACDVTGGAGANYRVTSGTLRLAE